MVWEISQQLGVRYQNVRNVLVKAGITAGLRRQVEAEREPVVVDALPAPRETTSWDVLLHAGFQFQMIRPAWNITGTV
jgi:hypothetical protein